MRPRLASDLEKSPRSTNGAFNLVIPLGDEFAFDSRRERSQIGLRRAILRGRESEEGRIKANEGTDRKEEGHREDG
jgi:hypothetical protein